MYSEQALIDFEINNMIKLDWDTLAYNTPHIASEMNVNLTVLQADPICKFKIYRVGLFKYIPHEHAGRFGSIPQQRLWFV